MSKRWIRATGAFVLAFGLVSVAQATVHTVQIRSNFFSPTKTTVNHGDTVKFVLIAGIHTTTSDPSSAKSWDSGTLSTFQEEFPVVFTVADGPGPFPYHCDFHFGMVDTIFVAPSEPCCVGVRGNADADPGEGVDISDLQVYIDFLFFSGPAPLCFEEFDVLPDVAIDISDLQAIIDYLFFGGTLISCP